MKTANGFRIDFDEVINVTYELLREFGRDYVYKTCPIMGCAYVHRDIVTDDDGEEKTKKVPGCIVGQILFRLGVPLEALDYYGSLTEHTRGRILRDKGIELTDRAFDFLTMAQFFQDQGSSGGPDVTWGRAVDYADGIVRRYRYTSTTEERIPWSRKTNDYTGD